jgi:hypothetical protein
MAEERRLLDERLEARLLEERRLADERTEKALLAQTSQCFAMFAVSSLTAKHVHVVLYYP